MSRYPMPVWPLEWHKIDRFSLISIITYFNLALLIKILDKYNTAQFFIPNIYFLQKLSIWICKRFETSSSNQKSTSNFTFVRQLPNNITENHLHARIFKCNMTRGSIFFKYQTKTSNRQLALEWPENTIKDIGAWLNFLDMLNGNLFRSDDIEFYWKHKDLKELEYQFSRYMEVI